MGMGMYASYYGCVGPCRASGLEGLGFGVSGVGKLQGFESFSAPERAGQLKSQRVLTLGDQTFGGGGIESFRTAKS